MSDTESTRSLWIAGALLLLAAFALIGASVLLVGDDLPPPGGDDAADIASLLTGDPNAGFEAARAGVPVEFPRDHGAHPGHRIEWWYFVGNLDGANGNAFGYQVTFFRFANQSGKSDLDSDFGGDQVWMAHVALTDVAERDYFSAERFSRQGPGLAGANADTFEVWLHDWSATGSASDVCEGCLVFDLAIETDEFALSLQLSPQRPLVRHGQDGFSAKTRDGKSGSHYYSMTRLETTGTVRVKNRSATVAGTSWLDREWSSSNLGEAQTGWDWFALQLDNGDDLMLYRLRNAAGETDTAYSVIVNATGRDGALDQTTLRMTPVRYWRSDRTKTQYPVAWEIADAQTTLRVEAVIDHQEHDGLFRYWEGAVTVSGSIRDETVTGRGYVEMTGYGESSATR